MLPNILLIVADDMGAGDTPWSAEGLHHKLHMPNLAWLKSQGVELMQYYVQPSCAPTRSSLMTGGISNHLGTQNGGWHTSDAAGLPLDEVTLAENLADAGYDTAIMGKWHLGYYKTAFMPTERGFSTQRGYYNAENDYFTHTDSNGYDWHVNDEPSFDQNGTFTDWLLRDDAVAFLKVKRSKPFFLYLPMQAVHAPLQVPPAYEIMYPNIDDAKKKTKAGMLTALDDALGTVFTTLNSTSAALHENTITIFFTDNGAPLGFGGSNEPYREGKHWLYEGGIRVPAIVHAASPALLPSTLRGTVHNGWFHVTDWLPTLVKLAGGSTAKNKPLDGFDVWPAVVGGVNTPTLRTELFHCDVDQSQKTSMKGPFAALRVRDLKLLQHKDGTNEVYNVSTDVSEVHDLVTVLPPATLAHLLKRLAWHRNDSVPAWRSDAACLPTLGPVDFNGSLVWMPTCDIALRY